MIQMKRDVVVVLCCFVVVVVVVVLIFYNNLQFSLCVNVLCSMMTMMIAMMKVT